MPRKPKKGYYVKGEFVAEGSARDLELKAELKGLRETDDSTRSDQKKESQALQTLGQELLELHPKTLERLQLPEKLLDALHEYQRLSNFEARRRQLQFVGKLMRKLEDSEVAAARTALHEQRSGTGPQQTQILLAEQWRERLIADDAALTLWLEHCPDTDVQPLRALVRQARRDQTQTQAQTAAAEGAPPAKKGRAYRDLFQLLRRSLNTDAAAEEEDRDGSEDEAND